MLIPENKEGTFKKEGHEEGKDEGEEGEGEEGEHNEPEQKDEIVNDGFGNLIVKNKKLEMRGDYYAIIYLGYIKEN